MKKIGLVYRRNASSWVSCQSITRNLIQCYKNAFPEAEIVTFENDASFSIYEVRRQAHKAAEFGPDLLAFLDHAPHPGVFLSFFDEAALNSSTRIALHVFGDFTLHPGAWLEMGQILCRRGVKFICASEKQKRLVQKFLVGSDQLVESIPFPVDEKQYYVDLEVLPSRADEFKCLYAGRLSLQKNVLPLVRSFATFIKNFHPKAELCLAGPMDDMGYPYLGKVPPPGLLAFDLNRLIEESLPEHLQKRIRYLGILSPEQLRRQFNHSHIMISLSGHNDEDFGMAPAEALLSGCPVILSDWGGYSSFGNIDSKKSRLLPVRIGEKSVVPEHADVIKALITASTASLDLPERLRIQEAARSYCSISSVSEKLRNSLGGSSLEQFERFSPLFSKVSQAFQINPSAPFKSGNGFSNLYREIYDCYL